LKILIEPSRFRDFLSSLLIYKSKPLIESVIANFMDKGVAVKDITLQTAAVCAVYTKKYFLEYEGNGETVVLTNTLLDGLKRGFKDEKITIETTDTEIIIRGSEETYSEQLTEKEPEEFPIEVTNTPKGILPKDFKSIVQVLIPADALSLPSAEKYVIRCDGKAIYVDVEDIGKYTKKLKIAKKETLGEVEVLVDGGFLQNMVSNLSGEIWLSLNNDVIIFSKKSKDHMLTYLLSTMEE